MRLVGKSTATVLRERTASAGKETLVMLERDPTTGIYRPGRQHHAKSRP